MDIELSLWSVQWPRTISLTIIPTVWMSINCMNVNKQYIFTVWLMIMTHYGVHLASRHFIQTCWIGRIIHELAYWRLARIFKVGSKCKLQIRPESNIDLTVCYKCMVDMTSKILSMRNAVPTILYDLCVDLQLTFAPNLENKRTRRL